MTGQTRKTAILTSAIMAVSLATQAWATSYTYTPPLLTGGTYNWNNAGAQNNWVSGFPNAAGDVANVTADISGTQNLNLNQAITIGTLNIGDSNGSNGYTIATGSGANVLTFQGANPGDATALSIGATGTSTNTISAGVSLGGTSPLTVTVPGTQKLTISGTLSLNGNQMTLAGAGAGAVLLSGDVTGSAAAKIVKTGPGAIEFSSGTKSFAGAIAANQGTSSNGGSINLYSGSLANASSITINGSLGSTLTQAGGSVLVGSNNAVAANPGQRLTTNTITLNGGTLTDLGQASTLTGGLPTWTTPVHDDVNTLRFNSGYSLLAMGAGLNSTGTEIAAANLQRGAGATVLIKSVNLLGNTTGQYSKVTAGNINTGNNGGSFLLGGGGAAGSKNMSIIPWIGTRYANANGSNPEGFATYEASTGLRSLKSSEYLSTAAFDADVAASATYGYDNVLATGGNFTLTADRTINSLSMTYAGGNLGAGRTLTVKSGGIFFANGNRDIGSGASGGTAAAGTLAFGPAEGVIWVQAGSAINNIGAAITGTGGLTVNVGAGTSMLVLTGSNNYSGLTSVSTGTLQVGGLFTVGGVANTLVPSNLGSGDVSVANGALLRLMSSSTIADTASVWLDQYGLSSISGKLYLDTSVSEQIAALYFGGVQQASGTWGASGSGADHIDNTYFSGTGVLNVVSVPEPMTLGAVAMAAGLSLVRRRRQLNA